MKASKSKVLEFIKNNVVFEIALVLAIVTSIIVLPKYSGGEALSVVYGYLDLKTLACLFATLAVVCALKNIKFFTIVARKIVKLAGNLRLCVTLIVMITYFGSMLIANDMALITFLPLGAFALSACGKEKHMAFTFIMQNIAANLGGMLTPFGNPQNLYLYNKFNIPTGEFMGIMAIPFAVATLMILACMLFLPKDKISITEEYHITLNVKRTIIYLVLFAISILLVFRIIPYYIALAIIVVTLIFLDYKALLKVDYLLLLTFVCFFIFAGNMSQIDVVRNFFASLLEGDTLLTSVLSCQCISNVPSSILLSQFTGNYRELLWGVNLGGAGTIIASLASLITYRTYVGLNPGKGGRYLGLFSALNFSFLIILTGLMELVKIWWH